MIDRSWIGKIFPAHTALVESGQLKFFAKATGATMPKDVNDLAAPPTFAFTLGLAQPDPFQRYGEMGIDLGYLLHGGQRFVYHAPIYAGDQITMETRITDIYDKKGGALEFIEEETKAVNQRGEHVVSLYSTVVVRNPGVGK